MKAKARSQYARFAELYIAKGENASAAYKELKPHVTTLTAGVEGYRLLKIPQVHKLIEERRAELRAKFALTTDRVVHELTRVAYFNPKRLFDEEGKIKKIHLVDDDTAAALVIEIDGDSNLVRVRTPPQAAKNTAVEKAVKILRLYDKPPPPPPEPPGAQSTVDPVELAKRTAYVLARGAHVAARAAEKPQKPVKRKLVVPS